MNRTSVSTLALTLLTSLLAACSDSSVTVNNTDPAVVIVAPQDGQTFERGEIVALSGVVSDPEDAADELTTTWNLTLMNTAYRKR